MHRSCYPLLILAATLVLTPVRAEPPADSASPDQKVISDPSEYDEYMTALNTADPLQKAVAMENFASHHPGSAVKIDALEQAMAAYQQTGNSAQVRAVAEAILQLDAANVRALAITTFLLRAQAAQGDASAASEARSRAERGLAALPGWPKPAGTSDADFARLRNRMTDIFEGAEGFSALLAKDYPTARSHYLKALPLDPTSIPDSYQLGVACLEMKPLAADGFWYLAHAINLSANNPAGQKSLAGYARSRYRRYHGSEDGWDALVAAAAGQTSPPADFSASISRAPTPAEIAVKAVQDNDPASLSFSDFEFVLALRDASPANQEAAKRVWQAIRDKQKNSTVRLKMPVQVIADTRDTIDAAVTEDNQRAHKADLHAILIVPVSQPPAPGSMITLSGELSDYTADPFMFIMKSAAVEPAAPVADK